MPKTLNIADIMEQLPHRYPFLLIDRVLELSDELDRVVAIKNVTMNEPQFTGHFPEVPVHTAFFCHMPELPYHQGNRLLSETVLSRLPAPRYLPVSAPVSAIMKPNMKAVKKKTAVTSNLKLPTPAA